MTTNPDLDQARKWPVGTVDKMNEWVESRLGFPLEPWQMDWLRQMEASLPDRLFGARATHPEYGEGIVISHFPYEDGGTVRFVSHSGATGDGTCSRWVHSSALTFHTPDMSKNAAEIDTFTEHVDGIDTTPDHPEFLETEEDYKDAPRGTIVAEDELWPIILTRSGWECPNRIYVSHDAMAGIRRRVLRWKWEA